MKERLSMERDVASYSFISWLDPYIHRRQAKYKVGNNDDAFDASMVNREGPVLETSGNSTQDDDMQSLCFTESPIADGDGSIKSDDRNLSESEMEGEEDDEDGDLRNENDLNKDNINMASTTVIPVSPSTASSSMINVAKSDIVEVLPDNTLNFPPIKVTPPPSSSSSSMMVDVSMPTSNNNETSTNDFAAPSFIMANVMKTKTSEMAFVPQLPRYVIPPNRKTVSTKSRPSNFLPKVSSYMSIKPIHSYNRNSKYNRLMEKYSGATTMTSSPKRFAVADSTKSTSSATKVPKIHQGRNQASQDRHGATNVVPQSSQSMAGDLSSNTDEGSLLVRLIKTKMDKLPERLKLSCQNELLQTVLKYELMAVDEKTKAQEKASVGTSLSTTLKDCNPPTKHQDILTVEGDENQIADSPESTVASSSADI